MNNDHNREEKQEMSPDNWQSNRSSLRREFEREQTAEERLVSLANGNGYISVPEISINAARGPAGQESDEPKRRLSRQQLMALLERLSARDLAILTTIRKYRFLTSDQVGRLFFSHCATKTSQTRNQNLLLKRLNEHGLIHPLERRIGGYGGGSGMQIWHLTSAGQRLITLNDPDSLKRKRYTEPSPMFIMHTLAIAEMAVQMETLCRDSHDLNLIALDTEPTCWRKYNDNDRAAILKPDMFVILSYDHYEDRYFMEMDLSSESMSEVVEKCDRYLRYYYSGIEQQETGMFPFVIWVVKDETRKAKLKEYIRNSIKAQPKMFLVITPDELEKLLRQDIDAKELL